VWRQNFNKIICGGLTFYIGTQSEDDLGKISSLEAGDKFG
jgi:hypothetical protein